VTENDQAFDTFEAAEPGAEPPNGGVIDFAVTGKRGDGGGDETSQIKGFHVDFLQGIDIGRITR
jgi:hypothetical protein